MLLAHNRNLRDLLDDTSLAAAPPGAARRNARALLSRADAHFRETLCQPTAKLSSTSAEQSIALQFASPVTPLQDVMSGIAAIARQRDAPVAPVGRSPVASSSASRASHAAADGRFDTFDPSASASTAASASAADAGAAAQLDTSGIGLKISDNVPASFATAFANSCSAYADRMSPAAVSADTNMFSSSPPCNTFAMDAFECPEFAKILGHSARTQFTALAEEKGDATSSELRLNASEDVIYKDLVQRLSAANAGTCAPKPKTNAQLVHSPPCDSEQLYESLLLAFAAITSMPAALGDAEKRALAQRYSFVQKIANSHTVDCSLYGQTGPAEWPVAQSSDLVECAVTWLERKAVCCKTEADFVNYGSWGELLVGVQEHRLSNCFLGGTGSLQGFIDSEMAQFAGMHWLATGDHMYLVWLGFARVVQIHFGTSILHATGPLHKLPATVSRAVLQPLGAAWSIGALPFSNIPTPEHYARVYLQRVHKMQTQFDLPCARSCPCALRARPLVKACRKRSSYRMRVGEDRLAIRGLVSLIETTVWTFGTDGLEMQQLRCALKRKQEGALSTSPCARLALATEQDGAELVRVVTFANPVPEIQRLFDTTDVTRLLKPGCGLTTRDLAVAHVLAGIAIQGGACKASGMGLCPLRQCVLPRRDGHTLWLPGPLSMGVLRASGWKVDTNGLLNWRREPVSEECLVLTNDMERVVPLDTITLHTKLVCRRHLGDTGYWRTAEQLALLVEESDDRWRRVKHDCIVAEYERQQAFASKSADVPKRPNDLVDGVRGLETRLLGARKDFVVHWDRLPRLLWLASAYVFFEILCMKV